MSAQVMKTPVMLNSRPDNWQADVIGSTVESLTVGPDGAIERISVDTGKGYLLSMDGRFGNIFAFVWRNTD